MKRYLLLFILLMTQFIFSQTNSEIIRWLNDFENSNSPSRIMPGTFDDKVFLTYDNGYLTINVSEIGPMLIDGTSSIYNYKFVIKVEDIIQIEAIELNKADYIFYDIKICTKTTNESLEIYRKIRNNSEYNVLSASEYQRWVGQFGYCSDQLRYKFSKDIAPKQLQRVYDALNQLAKNHNANPKIGSYY